MEPPLSDESKTAKISQLAQSCQDELIEKLVNAAARQDIKVDRRSVSVGIGPNGGVIINSAVKGIAKVDMIDYEKGVLTNFIFIDLRRTNLAPGFYAVRTVAPCVRLGRIDIRAHYLQDGKVVAVNQGIANVISLLAPADPPHPVRTGVRIAANFPINPAEDGLEEDEFGNPVYCTYTDCPNGGQWCHCEPYAD